MSEQPVAMIIGGGSGIGAGAARKLAADGYRVAVMSSSGKGEALGAELGGIGFTGSNLEPAEISAFFATVQNAWGRLDVLVNSAGHGPKGDIMAITDEEWHLGMEVYMLNVVRAARHALPMMQASGGGAIINISTFAAFEPDPVFPTSGIFRASLAGFTKLFSTRYAAEGISMNNILPGFIDSLPETPDRLARIPAGRYGTVDEVTGLISLLASKDGGYVTGQNIRVDGGLTQSV